MRTEEHTGREWIAVARCTVARLMRRIGLKDVVRGKVVKTTIGDKAAPCPLDRVNRQFWAPVPNIHLALVALGCAIVCLNQIRRLFLDVLY